MWIARDEDGTLAIYSKKPVKFKHEWMVPDDGLFFIVYDDEDSNEFSEVKWEDENPRELVLKPINE